MLPGRCLSKARAVVVLPTPNGPFNQTIIEM
jgi:hypothetical protein